MDVDARFEVLAEELMKNQASWEERLPKDFGFLVLIYIQGVSRL
jgi:hypothetical protein